MRKKNYKGRVEKRNLTKCKDVCRTFDKIQYLYADLLSESEDVESFQVNVLLEGLDIGDYTSDFVITKADGNIMVRECVSRNHLTKPLTINVKIILNNCANISMYNCSITFIRYLRKCSCGSIRVS